MDSSPVPACRPLRNQANSVRRADRLPQSPKVAQSPRSNEPSQRDVISKDGHSNWPPFLSWSHFAVNCEVTLWRGPSRFQCASSKIVAEVCDPGPSTAGLREASHKRTAIAAASDPNDIVNCEMDHEGSAYFGGPIAICCGRRAEAQNPSSLGQRGGASDGHPDGPSIPTTLLIQPLCEPAGLHFRGSILRRSYVRRPSSRSTISLWLYEFSTFRQKPG